MRRDLGAYLVLIAAVLALGGLAWLTRHPDAAIVRTAEAWPFLGPLARRFHEAYRPPPAPPQTPESSAEPAPERLPEASLPAIDPSPVDKPGRVWVLAGTEIKARPSADAITLSTVNSTGQLVALHHRGSWYRVRLASLEGWVHLEDFDPSGEPPYGRRAEPPRPLPPRAPDAEALALARSFLGDGGRELALGPYPLYTDHDDDPLVALLAGVVAQLEPAYVERYGRRPLGVPREAIVLYAEEASYRRLQARTGRLGGLRPAGHSSSGLAVAFAGGRSPAEITSTLIHELVHLLNRRALGPALPSWLDEGLADDLASSAVDETGRLRPDRLSGTRGETGPGEIRCDGALAALGFLVEDLRHDRLPALRRVLELEWEDFVDRSSVNYALSSFWIRFLLDARNGQRRQAFRGFLDAVAAGEPPTVATLEDRLGESVASLEPEFRVWLRIEAERAGVTATSRLVPD